MKKFKFPKLRMIWSIIRGRTVVYKARIDGGLTLTGDKGYVANCLFLSLGDNRERHSMVQV